jgi:hypothetical protein
MTTQGHTSLNSPEPGRARGPCPPDIARVIEAKNADEATTLLGSGWLFLGLAAHTNHHPSIWLGWPRTLQSDGQEAGS